VAGAAAVRQRVGRVSKLRPWLPSFSRDLCPSEDSDMAPSLLCAHEARGEDVKHRGRSGDPQVACLQRTWWSWKIIRAPPSLPFPPLPQCHRGRPLPASVLMKGHLF